MEVEEQEQQAVALEDNNASFAFKDGFNRNCRLSTKPSMLVFLKPIKFVITITLDNFLSLGSTAFLIGPKEANDNDA
ncbi:unnamed protein product [Lupinus luteus]|uniref:Uncharacterized protein n=1 Tax=Lupinus luteus TaxID=3873 RepID=A0AAV1W2J1_LUPLU